MKAMLFAAALAVPLPLAAQTAPPAAPVEHRLTPDEIAAAEEAGAERSRAAEALALSRGEPSLALPAEKRKPQVHGEAGVAFGSNGYREVYGAEQTTLSNGSTIGIAGDYATLNGPGRLRIRPF
ncbi:MAG: hypothetical protein JO290_07725 [Sphingomonadaceae bacterium]|nr:hypothetical protein [Sphingomonadaceae bacterium]